jgi:hypothetical protein
MPKLTAEQKSQIVSDRAAGISTKEIALKFGVHPSTILKQLKPRAEEIQSVTVPVAPDLEERAGFLDPEVRREPPQPIPNDQVLDKIFAGLAPEPVPVPVPAPIASGDPDELVQKILLNAESFPEMFPNTPSVASLATKSVRELADVLQSMETSRAVRMLTVQLKQVFLVGSRAIEMLGKQYLGLKTDGLTDGLIAQQKELDFIFRELAIKHSRKFGKVVEPEVRLLMLFGMAVLQTDATNRVRDRLASPASTTDKFDDL